ncbi:MAG: hypothetical protein WCQ16_04565 [Verrucomicrobiae bacterium]
MATKEPPAFVDDPKKPGDQKETKIMAIQYVAKVEGGTAKIYKTDGSFHRNVGTGVTSAVVAGNEVHITLSNGKVQIYGIDGSFKRQI